MKKNDTSSTLHIFKALKWSLKGLQSALKNDLAFRQELICLAVLFPLGIYLGRTASEKTLLVTALLLVLLTELLNSAIESVVDRISEEQHPLSGRAKDLGSAAVFIALLNVVVVWGIILFDILSG